MDRKIKNIIFDFGGVLVDLDKSRCVEAFQRLGYPDVMAMVGKYQQYGVFASLEDGSISSEVFCDEIRHDAAATPTNSKIIEAWNMMLGVIPKYKLDALLKLRKYYMVYLLSNTNSIHWDYACKKLFPYHGFDVNDYFEEIFLSFKMKMVKPHPEIFLSVQNQTGIMASQTLLIDDCQANCDTAQNLGFSVYCPKDDEDWRCLFPEL